MLSLNAIAAALALSLFATMSQAQTAGDFTGQPAQGTLLIRYPGCYSFQPPQPLPPLANGSCPPGSTYGYGSAGFNYSQKNDFNQLPSSLVPQIQISQTGYFNGSDGSLNNYSVAVPLSDFATASSVNSLRSQVGAIIAGGSVADETVRATAAEGQLGANITGETTRATSAEAQLGTGLRNETARATAVESSLAQSIGAETLGRVADVARLSRQFKAGTAAAVALGGNVFIPGKTMNVTVNVGTYRGESAISVQGGYVLKPNIYVNMGLSSATRGGGTAARTGLTLGW
jgi:hypothetical protein